MILRGEHDCKPFHLTIPHLKFSPQAIIPWGPSGAKQRLRNPRKLAALLCLLQVLDLSCFSISETTAARMSTCKYHVANLLSS